MVTSRDKLPDDQAIPMRAQDVQAATEIFNRLTDLVGAAGVGGALLPEPQPGAAATVDTPGFCYLALARPDARNTMKRALGRNPYLAQVVAWLQVNSSVHSSAKFEISLGVEALDMHNVPAFVQAHVSESPSGARLKQILAIPTVDVRLGADVQVASRTDPGGPGRSERTVSLASTPPLVRIPFAANLRHTAGALTFSPRTSPAVKNVTKYFESAEIVEFSASAAVSGGAAAQLAMGFGTGGACPGTIDAFVTTLPSAAVCSGDQNAVGRGEIALSPEHGFGREVKAVSLGNPDPILFCLLDKETLSGAQIRGHVTLRLSGSGVATPLVLTGSAPART